MKHMHREGDRIKLQFLSAVAGQRGDSLLVTQEEWDEKGEWRQVPSTSREALRKYA